MSPVGAGLLISEFHGRRVLNRLVRLSCESTSLSWLAGTYITAVTDEEILCDCVCSRNGDLERAEERGRERERKMKEWGQLPLYILDFTVGGTKCILQYISFYAQVVIYHQNKSGFQCKVGHDVKELPDVNSRELNPRVKCTESLDIQIQYSINMIVH